MAADKYRRLAAECLRIAEDVINSQSRNLLIHMSQSWLRLAHQYEQNLAPTRRVCHGAATTAAANPTQERRVGPPLLAASLYRLSLRVLASCNPPFWFDCRQ